MITKKDKIKAVIIGGLIGVCSTLYAYYKGQNKVYNEVINELQNINNELQKEQDQLTAENENMRRYLFRSDKKVS